MDHNPIHCPNHVTEPQSIPGKREPDGGNMRKKKTLYNEI